MTELAMRNERRLRFGFGTDAMKKLKVCALCGTVSHVKLTKCPACGTVLPKETLYTIYKARHKQCEHCHAVVANEATFCPACGRKLRTEVKTDGQYHI